MMYQPLGDLAEAVRADLAEHVPALGGRVKVAAATNAAQLLSEIDALTMTPGAVVVLGRINYPPESNGLARQVQVIVAVADKFRRTTSGRAEGIWPLADAIADRFLPRFPPGGGAENCEIADCEWEVESMTPGAGDERVAIFFVNLLASEYAQNEEI